MADNFSEIIEHKSHAREILKDFLNVSIMLTALQDIDPKLAKKFTSIIVQGETGPYIAKSFTVDEIIEWGNPQPLQAQRLHKALMSSTRRKIALVQN